jgi:hypothetical protein
MATSDYDSVGEARTIRGSRPTIKREPFESNRQTRPQQGETFADGAVTVDMLKVVLNDWFVDIGRAVSS